MDSLFKSASPLDVEIIRHQLEKQFIGCGDRLSYVPTIDSTNSLAMQLGQKSDDEGLVVIADNQTAGRGRQGRRWVDVPGRNVLLSLALRPAFPPHLLVMLASLAVVDAISDMCGVAATIKWPNDVLIDERKVAGILIETSHDANGSLVAVVGIGINVNGQTEHVAELLPGAAELVANATTIETACGHPVSREMLIVRLLQHAEADYLALQQEGKGQSGQESASGQHSQLSSSRLIRERWSRQLSTLGRTVNVYQGETIISGIAEDVDGNGELLLRRHSGELVRITWGSIEYVHGYMPISQDR